MWEFSREELALELDKKEKELMKYKEIVKKYEIHFEKSNDEFKEMKNETKHMRNVTEELRAEMKKVVEEYNKLVLKHKEIEEAFVNIAFMAQTSPDECIEKLSNYYVQFKELVNMQTNEATEKKKRSNFKIIKGGK